MRVTGLELFAVPPGWLFHVDGHIAVPTAPGLGVEIDEERVREAAAHGRM
jgi:L-alanine-DL-glutamate epimerase-like enolase superfamily enzyme